MSPVLSEAVVCIFIYIIINSNHKISSSLYNNIQKIKNGNYVDEEDLDAIDKNSNSSGNLTPKNIRHLSSYIWVIIIYIFILLFY